MNNIPEQRLEPIESNAPEMVCADCDCCDEDFYNINNRILCKDCVKDDYIQGCIIGERGEAKIGICLNCGLEKPLYNNIIINEQICLDCAWEDYIDNLDKADYEDFLNVNGYFDKEEDDYVFDERYDELFGNSEQSEDEIWEPESFYDFDQM